MIPQRVGVVGEVFLDVPQSVAGAPGSRLGGVLHACRALSALGATFSCAPILPEYLMGAARDECSALGGECTALGVISGSPNVAVYRDAVESGNQGVLMPVLPGSHECALTAEALDYLPSGLTDALIIPGYYPLQAVTHRLADAGIRLHIDIAYDTTLAELLDGPAIETIFLSTSSDLFLSRWSASPPRAWAELASIAKSVVLKESRGGSRAFSHGPTVGAPAFVGLAKHSIGVGDCFDATFVHLAARQTSDRLELSSAVAAAYADTWDQPRFAETAVSILEGGRPADHVSISLPWEARPGHSIYMAAPDFPGVNTTPLDGLVEALEYHNFHCRLPIRENGVADTAVSRAELDRFCEADLRLLDECKLLVAVMLFDDPGTLIEIGMAAERGLPVIVYDPYDRARNVMLRCVPKLLSSDLSAVVTAVFHTIGEAHASI